MSEYLKLKPSNCKNCYKCIRHCPVKSIQFSDQQAHILPEECILCGQCFVVCPQNAKEIRNDVAVVRSLIQSGSPVYVSLAPSFVANYGVTFRSMEKALLSLGFTAVEETALGAQLVKQRYDELTKEGKMDVIISSCCYTVNLLIEKYHPETLPYLAPVLSPMQTHCKRIKEEHPGAKTVFIGPCISKKAETDDSHGNVDCALTFEELTEWLQNEHIVFENLPDEAEGTKSRLFPTTGGILRSMKCEEQGYTYLTVDGVQNCIAALEDIAAGNLTHCFVEMSACASSCIGGPVMEKNRRAPVRDYVAVNRFAGKEDLPLAPMTAEAIHEDWHFKGVHKTMPGSRAIEEILRQMGKTKPEDELNCGSCGYDTCREKAIAVYFGKADLSMCLPFLKEKAESFSDHIIQNTPNGIIVLNESLEVQQINAAARSIMNIKQESDVLGEPVVRILDPQIFFEVLNKGNSVHDKRVYLPEYQRYVEESVVYDKSYHIIMCIMRDVTSEETSKWEKENLSRQTIEVTDKVIEKQMRAVQEIASLLGETTAETKIALTRLKESLK